METEENELKNISFFNSWKKMYALVIGTLVFLIIIFYLFTKYFE